MLWTKFSRGSESLTVKAEADTVAERGSTTLDLMYVLKIIVRRVGAAEGMTG
jgi:hypothetical protein